MLTAVAAVVVAVVAPANGSDGVNAEDIVDADCDGKTRAEGKVLGCDGGRDDDKGDVERYVGGCCGCIVLSGNSFVLLLSVLATAPVLCLYLLVLIDAADKHMWGTRNVAQRVQGVLPSHGTFAFYIHGVC